MTRVSFRVDDTTWAKLFAKYGKETNQATMIAILERLMRLELHFKARPSFVSEFRLRKIKHDIKKNFEASYGVALDDEQKIVDLGSDDIGGDLYDDKGRADAKISLLNNLIKECKRQ